MRLWLLGGIIYDGSVASAFNFLDSFWQLSPI